MKRFLLVIAALAWLTQTVVAETSLTIEQAVALSREKNLSLQRTRVDLEAAQRAIRYSWNSYLPTATAGLGLNGSFYSMDNWSTYGSLAISLSVSPSILEEAKQIRLAYDAKAITMRQAERSLELSVRKAFYALLLADEKVRLAAQKIERAKQSLETVKQKYDAGLVPELNVLSAQVSVEELKPDLLSAEAGRDTSFDAFKLLLGIDMAEPLALKGNLDESTRALSVEAASKAAADAAIKDTLGVQALSNSLLTAQSALKAKELASTIPSGTVSVSTKPTLSSWVTGPKVSDSGSLSLSFSFNLAGLLAGSSTQAAIETAKDSVKKIESQIAEEKLNVASNAQSYLRSIKTALGSLAAYGSNISLAQKTYDLTNESYQKGLSTLSELQSASASLDDARVGLLGEAYTLLAAVLNLENTLDLEFGTITR